MEIFVDIISSMADKKGVILIRFPEALAEELRLVSFESKIPIKDIVSEIVAENLLEWRRKHVITEIRKTSSDLDDLHTKIEKYAASKSISLKDAIVELGVDVIFEKALAGIETSNNEIEPK